MGRSALPGPSPVAGARPDGCLGGDPTGRRWLVDAMNVIGSRPDGWWRDRRGAKVALVEQLAAWCRATGEVVTAVFDGWGPSGVAGVEVVACPGGPNAADDEIARRVVGDAEPAGLVVATSDATLVARVRANGAVTEGARRFRARLEEVEPFFGRL